MKQGIHPEYYQAKVVCNCGNEFVTGSTKENIRVEICSKCHSFYTGQQKAAIARGAIDKFNRRYGLKFLLILLLKTLHFLVLLHYLIFFEFLLLLIKVALPICVTF